MGARRIIPIEVKDEYVIGAGRVIGSVGSHDDVALRAVFNDMWDGTSKTAVWLNALGEDAVVQPVTSLYWESSDPSVCIIPIPEEAKSAVGNAMLTIKGFTSADGVTETTATITATAYFRVLESDYDQDASDSGSITLNQSEQFQATLTAMQEDIANAAKAADAAERAGSWASEAEDAKISAEEDANTAKKWRDEAEVAAKRAEDAAKKAEDAGGINFTTDETLALKEGVLSVNTADKVEDNTLPITAAAVNTTVGNIEVLLSQI